LSRIFWLVGLHDFSFDDIPVSQIKVVLLLRFSPADSFVSEAHLEFEDLAVDSHPAMVAALLILSMRRQAVNVSLSL
jgi:hypothetical protein